MRADKLWHLAGEVTHDRHHQIELIRELSSDEAAQANDSAKLVGWLTTHSRWNPLHHRWTELSRNLASRRGTRPDESKLGESLDQFASAYIDFGLQVRSAKSLFDSEDRWTKLDALLTSSGWRQLIVRLEARTVSGAAIETRSVQRKPGQVEWEFFLTSAGREWFGFRGDTPLSAVQLLEQAMVFAAQIHDALLVAFEPQITAASLLLKRLGAEVLVGAPFLLSDAHGFGATSPVSNDIQSLWIENIGLLTLATRQAVERSPKASRSDPPPIAPEPLVADEAEDQGDNKTDSEPPESTPAVGVPPTRRTIPAVDTLGLLRESLRMTFELERAWSNALATTIDDETIEPELAKWQSLLISEVSAIQGSDDTREWPWPLDASATLKVLSDPGHSPNAIAVSVAMRRLTESMQGLRGPQAAHVDLEAGNLSIFWSSGAFAATRWSASLLNRIGHPVDPTSGSTSDASDWLELADRSLRAGATEAALLYLFRSYNSYVQSTNFSEAGVTQAARTSIEMLVPLITKEVRSPDAESDVGQQLLLADVGLRVMTALVGPGVHVRVEPADG